MHAHLTDGLDRRALSASARVRSKLDAALDDCLADLAAVHQFANSQQGAIAIGPPQRVIDHFLSVETLVPNLLLRAIRELPEAWKEPVGSGDDPACIRQSRDRVEREIVSLLVSINADSGSLPQFEAAE